MNSLFSQIRLLGCREHNLKNFSLSLPKMAITALTGVSGSGKSSLAFDILFAEGQRRYLEYLSSQTRTWIKQMPKPDVDLIEGLSPTLAVSQSKEALSSRGTIATYTDIYDFLSLLYAKVGEQHSPSTGKKLIRHSRQEIIHILLTEFSLGTKIQLLSPIKFKNESANQVIVRLQQMGYVRLKINGEEWTSDMPIPTLSESSKIDAVVDRIEIKDGVRDRLASSVETALDLSQGILKIQEGRLGSVRFFTEIYVCPETSFSFPPLSPADFNFNSPKGACSACHGTGGLFEESVDESRAHWKECSTCHGERLKSESLACLIHGKNISSLCSLTVSEMIKEIKNFDFSKKSEIIAQEILPAIQKRLELIEQVGLGYLELNRRGQTLSDGEAQRIQLASQIGARLSGIIYILDEPSLGLHAQDIKYLQKVIEELKTLGNTVIIVEHEKALIKMADHVVELGAGAGQHGGRITFEGTFLELLDDPNSLTGKWISGRKTYLPPIKRKKNHQILKVNRASLHNLHNVSLKIPLGRLVGFCGVSGSGKSTLALDLIGNGLRLHLAKGTPIPFLEGFDSIKRLVLGEKVAERFSARSIPATYVGLMTPLRQLFAETRLAKARGYTASRFSLNKRGGRCDACDGIGELKVNLQLMPDLHIPCDVCEGLRYNFETLQVHWENRSIADVLSFSIDEAAHFFKHVPSLAAPLEMMQQLGLGYMTLGQPSRTLSGGEIQRLKLTADLCAKNQESTLYILDEPSAGLHFEDIEKLIAILHQLVDKGHTVFLIEHHLSLLQQADWLIELGPGGGPNGGQLIFQGTPKQLAKEKTPTGLALSIE